MSAVPPPRPPARIAQRARRRRARRSIAIATVSTVVVHRRARDRSCSPAPAGRACTGVLLNGHWFNVSFARVLSGFWLDVRMFLIVEVGGAGRSGCVIALIRTVRIPALFPLRWSRSCYVDVMRGMPTMLLVYLVGFGVPALNLSGPADDADRARRDRAGHVLRRVRLGGLPRRASSRSTRARRGAALALGLTPAQALRHVVVPAGGAPRDPAAAERLHRAPEGRRAGLDHRPAGGVPGRADLRRQYFNYTPLLAAAALYLCVTIPLTRIVDQLRRAACASAARVLALGPR